MSTFRVNGSSSQVRAIALIGCELIGYSVSRDSLRLTRLLALVEMACLLDIMTEADHALVMEVIGTASIPACSSANSIQEVHHG